MCNIVTLPLYSAWSGKLYNLFTVLLQCNVLRISHNILPVLHSPQAKSQQQTQQ